MDVRQLKSESDFDAVVSWLPSMLRELLASPVYSGDHLPPAGQVGIYLFSRGKADLYVGRTGKTARSRAGETKHETSFRMRFKDHTLPGSPPGTAPFANRILKEKAKDRGAEPPPSGWWKQRKGQHAQYLHWFTEAKAEIAQMDFRIVAFEDDESGVISTVAETYAHVCLNTPYNNFLTS